MDDFRGVDYRLHRMLDHMTQSSSRPSMWLESRVYNADQPHPLTDRYNEYISAWNNAQSYKEKFILAFNYYLGRN
jgi:hypothetical protein